MQLREVLKNLGNLRHIHVRKHLRRLRARWRLHRMEWEGRARPLEPPRGYEFYYRYDEMFPGRKNWPPPSKSWKEFRTRLYWAWRLYRHHYIRDPQIAEMLRIVDKESDKTLQADIQTRMDATRKNMRKYTDHAGEVLQKFTVDAKAEYAKKRPEAEEVLKDRSKVLQDAMSKFSEGYREGLSGSLNWLKFDDHEGEDDFEFPGFLNMPVRYEAQSTDRNPEAEKPSVSTTSNEKRKLN